MTDHTQSNSKPGWASGPPGTGNCSASLREFPVRRARRRGLRALVLTLGLSAAIAAAPVGAASAAEGPTFPPRTAECKVPPLLFQAAAVVDPDSLEGCGFFEDPNYHENRKAAGIYNPNGPFSILFG